MSAQSSTHRVTPPALSRRKGQEPIVALMAYAAPTAKRLDECCDLILVGDSLGMVHYGMESTLGVSLEMMIAHGHAVAAYAGDVRARRFPGPEQCVAGPQAVETAPSSDRPKTAAATDG